MLTIDDVACDEWLGFLCNCVLPAGLNETKVRQVRTEGKVQEVEKKKLRSHSSRFVSSNPPPRLASCPPDSAMSSRQRRCLPSSSSSLIHTSSTSSLSLKL